MNHSGLIIITLTQTCPNNEKSAKRWLKIGETIHKAVSVGLSKGASWVALWMNTALRGVGDPQNKSVKWGQRKIDQPAATRCPRGEKRGGDWFHVTHMSKGSQLIYVQFRLFHWSFCCFLVFVAFYLLGVTNSHASWTLSEVKKCRGSWNNWRHSDTDLQYEPVRS